MRDSYFVPHCGFKLLLLFKCGSKVRSTARAKILRIHNNYIDMNRKHQYELKLRISLPCPIFPDSVS